MSGRVLVVVVALLALATARADAATYCVGVQVPGCTEADTAVGAFAAARQDADLDTIVLGRLTEAGAFADAPGRPVRVIGAGAAATVLRAASGAPALRLQDEDSSASELRLESAGGAALQLDDGGSLRSSVVSGLVSVRGGDAELGSVAVSGGPGVLASCAAAGGELALSHVTVAGTGAAGVSAVCQVKGRTLALHVDDTIVWGFQRGFAVGLATTLAADHSDFPEASGGGNVAVDPRFAGPADLRLRADSPLVDAGRPGLLTATEAHEDAFGFVRAADGNGDGAPRRDVGAFELQPPAPPVPAGNVLANPGAEAGTAAGDDTSSPAPPGWRRTGDFTSVRYGTVAGVFPFPTRRVGEALGAGTAFFAAGPGRGGTATQIADLSGAAPEIDRGLASARLSALLGGYRASADGAIIQASFRGPGGARLGGLEIGPVTAEQRAGASNLLPRAATRAIPPLTRSIAVTMRSTPASGGYDDAYFDSAALVPTVGGRPARKGRRPGRRVRPYAGVVVTSGRVAVDSRRRGWVRIACPSGTVGKCRGVLTLASRLGGRAERRIGRREIVLAAGHTLRQGVRLRRIVPRRMGKVRRMRAHVYVATRDRQGVTRTSTAPVRLVRGRFPRGD